MYVMHKSSVLSCALLLLLLCHVRLYSTDSSTQVNFIWNSLFQFSRTQESANSVSTSVSSDKTACIGCGSNLYDDEELHREITALRIEYIKNQILKKLRLKEKPSISIPISGLPRPVTEDENLFPRNQDSLFDDYSDDYYGKTTQAIIFPQKDDLKCNVKKRNPSACLPFEIPADMYSSDVSMAELWVYKIPDILDSHNQTFVVSEVAHWDTKRSFQKTKPVAMKETSITEGWIKINIAWAVKNWFEYSGMNHVLNVACKTCGMDTSASPISFKQEHKPFIVIYTYSQPRRRQQRRMKRNVNCVPGINACCRESLYVSFDEIGWSDWILHPHGYNAYFCRGSCSVAASVTLSGSHHYTIMQKVVYGNNKKLDLVPCCAPTQFKDLELLLLHDNKTLSTKILPNMIVETCGCM